jgi:hypothetical protein
MTGFKRTTTTPLKLTPELQRIRAHAAKYPDDFCQTQLKVKDKGAKTVAYHDNWTQREIQKIINEEEAKKKPLRLYILKSRRVGSSMKMVYRFFARTWAEDDLEALILSQQEERSEELLDRIKFAYAMLPAHLKLALSKDSTSGLQYADTRGKITIASARNLAVARGGTKQLLLLSEFAFYQKQSRILKEFLAPIAYQFGTEAIIETTGGNYGSEAHDLWIRSRAGKTVFRAEFMDWRKDPECDVQFASDRERDLAVAEAIEFEPRLLDRMRHYKLTPGQVYYSYMVLKSVCDGDYGWYLNEYPADEHEAWLSQQLSFFGNENVNKLRQHTSEFPYYYYIIPPELAIDKDFAEMADFNKLKRVSQIDENDSRPFFKVWKGPRSNGEYVVSGDSAEGVEGGNFSSSFVIDQYTFEMMAEFHGRLRPDQHGFVMGFLGNVYNVALMAPEINPPGNVAFTTLSSFYNNFYVWKHPYMDDVTVQKGRKLGWVTNVVSRSTMLAFGKRLVEDIANDRLRLHSILKSRELLNEMGTFAPDEATGKPMAIPGAQDDRVLAWCIAIYVAHQETHGSDRDIFNLYKTQTDEPQAQPFDLSGMIREPREVIQRFAELWDRQGPRWKDNNNGQA